MANPTVVFVPGIFHTPFYFQPIISQLEKISFPSIAVTLPTIGKNAGVAELKDDVQAIQSILENLINNEHKEVILVLHSHGGNPGCQAILGLQISGRPNDMGGVIHILFVNAFLIPDGNTTLEILAGEPPSWSELDGPVIKPGAACGSVFYSGLSAEEAHRWSKELRPQSASVSVTPVENTCWHLEIPSTYVMNKADAALSIAIREDMLEKVKHNNWTVEYFEGDHTPFLSNAGVFLDLIVKVAQK